MKHNFFLIPLGTWKKLSFIEIMCECFNVDITRFDISDDVILLRIIGNKLRFGSIKYLEDY